jgi:molybdopterin/thiamine biosynthesis adenylyltransferase
MTTQSDPRWDRVERWLGSDNLAHLAQRRVAVVGLGSGGGLVALHLAMSGVGNFILIDDDVLEDTNIVRHVADRRYLGQPKAEAVADLIRQRNPNAQVEVRVGRIEQHMDALDNIDLLVSAVDGEGPKYVLNQAALDRTLTAVYAGVYERGEGGDVVLIHPYDGPCYACWAAELRDDLLLAKGDGKELDYGMIGESGTLEAEPGLWLHVTRVATVQAQIILNELLKGSDIYEPLPGNTVILANSALEIVTGPVSQPHTAIWVSIDRDPNCLVCGDKLQHQMADEQQQLSLSDLMDTTGMVLQENDED